MGFGICRRVVTRLFSTYYYSAAVAASKSGSGSSSSFSLLSKRNDCGAYYSSKLWASSSSRETQKGMAENFYRVAESSYFRSTKAMTTTRETLIVQKLYSTESDGNLVHSNDSFGAAEIAARGWQITEESESDWRGHAAAVARSIQLVKTRMEWTRLLSRLRQLDQDLLKPDLWDNPSSASKISRERGGLAGRIQAVKDMESELVEQIGMAELAREEKDKQVEDDAKEALAALRKVAKEKELAALLAGEHDECSCYLEVQAGAGGVESMDWAAMILRMYRMWAMNKGYEVAIVEEMFGEEAGIKRGTIRIDGQFAYGYAKGEAGVHRLVRISPFDAGKRRHTSFAAVAVMPVLDESAIKIEIDESDLRIERYRAGGAGGQHVNKTESAVRIVHIPTGIVVQCQADRSQHRNKATALGVLQSRLYQMETERRARVTAQHTETLGDITWGNQIRSYVLQPYQMVKDLRTGYEDSDPATVLDGDLDSFILRYLASQVREKSPLEGAQ
ncbi:unnamed protein product [Calypogeia fissa]